MFFDEPLDVLVASSAACAGAGGLGDLAHSAATFQHGILDAGGTDPGTTAHRALGIVAGGAAGNQLVRAVQAKQQGTVRR